VFADDHVSGGCIVSNASEMPFMKGRAPIRRTLKYLEAGCLVLKERINIFCVNYNYHGDHHKGARYILFTCGMEYSAVCLVSDLE
jgi:hypothetical protein